MSEKSPGIFEVAKDSIKDNFIWVVENPLYRWYYALFIVFGTAGIWFDFVFPRPGVERGSLFEIFSFAPLLTFSAPIAVAILAKDILIGFSGRHDAYPMKTLRTFCFLYFIIVIVFFVIGSFNADGKATWCSIFAVIMLLIFHFLHGAKDKDYEDVSLDVSRRNASDDKKSLDGDSYD